MPSRACGLSSGVVVATYLGSVGLERVLMSRKRPSPEPSPPGAREVLSLPRSLLARPRGPREEPIAGLRQGVRAVILRQVRC